VYSLSARGVPASELARDDHKFERWLIRKRMFYCETHSADTAAEPAVVPEFAVSHPLAAVLVPLRMMAERENAKEKAMQRAMPRRGLVQEMARADVDPAPVMDVADSGPRPRST
jgi:hypothetical protein